MQPQVSWISVLNRCVLFIAYNTIKNENFNVWNVCYFILYEYDKDSYETQIYDAVTV